MRENDYIYLVTPHYLSAILKESEPYSFAIKGYHNEQVALRSLMHTNQSRILGYLLVYDELPFDLNGLIEFIEFVNSIGTKETVMVLCCKEPDGLEDYLIPNIDVSNITFYHTSDFDVLTDLYIRRNLFGTIIKDKKKPYLESNVLGEVVVTSNSNNHLTPVLPGDILSILSPVMLLSTIEVTCDHDKVLISSRDNSLVSFMRHQRIRYLFNKSVDFNGMISRIQATSSVDKTLYITVAHMIQEGSVNSRGEYNG